MDMWNSGLSIYRSAIYLLLLSGSQTVGQPQHWESPFEKRPVTVRDTIEMTKLGDPQYFWGRSSVGRVAQFSPNREQFVVVLRKGNIAENTNEYSIVHWYTRDLFGEPRPDTLLRMSSSSNLPAIENVRWLPDNLTIVFMGAGHDNARQIYKLNVSTRVLTQISHSTTNVIAYSMDQKGQQFAYTAEAPTEPLWNEKTARDGVVVETHWLDMLIGGRQQSGWSKDALLYVLSNFRWNGSARLLASVPDGWGDPILSPNGDYVIIDLEADAIPEMWKDYTDPKLHKWTRRRLVAGQRSFLRRFVSINTKTGVSQVLLNAPIVLQPKVTWDSDGQSATIEGTYLPLEHTTRVEREARQSKLFNVKVSIPGAVLTRITLGDQTIATQMPWQRQQAAHDEQEIVLAEGMNDPPKIFAVDTATHRRALVLDLNPQFRNLDFAKVEEITWKGSDGHVVKGGLYYPVNYVPGQRYPLVIQTHAWQPERFWIDGPWTTAFAAQPLAAKKIMVLQAEESYDDFDTLKEKRREVATFEGAVDDLDRRGMIDREHVGLIGFSRTGGFVAYALAFSPYHFAAAAVQDGVDGGYMSYMLTVSSNPSAQELETILGATPFGTGLQRWIDNSPSFHLERVNTPLRLIAPQAKSLLGQWEWFAGLRRLGKPVELVLMKDAAHILERPADRMVSQGGNVDWFCFWLKGEEDTDPSKAQQYASWRELRHLHEQIKPDNAASAQSQ